MVSLKTIGLVALTWTMAGCIRGSEEKEEGPVSTDNTGAPDWAADAGVSPEARAETLLARMTLEEKIDYIGGDRGFYIRPVERLGIPEIKMSDGPVGCRNWGDTTAYPATVGLAASFDTDLAEAFGRSLGRDCRARGVHILLAPGLNIHRSPLTGRNFEYLGEDPLLAGKMAAATIRGIQGEGVLATAKHFVANNQEWNRNHISSEVDERTLREIYLPAFETAVKEGNVQAVMTAYNLLNGAWCSHNGWLLNGVLKREWGFDGIVMSDWNAVHDTLGATLGGCDLEMPSGAYMNLETLLPLVAEGAVAEEVIDEKVRRILRTIAAAGFLDRPQQLEEIPLDDPTSRETALEVARKSMVLLKNERNVLPLPETSTNRIALIGPNVHPGVPAGAGSAYTTPNRVISLRDGLEEAYPGEVVHHTGLQQLSQTEVEAQRKEITQMAADADAVIVSVGFGQSSDTNSAAEAFKPAWPEGWAHQAGLVESEGRDRPFDLPAEQVETIRLAATANPNTVVIVNAGGAVNLQPFLDNIPALLWAWYPGQEGGEAMAEILLGRVTPSGKLPATFAVNYADYPSAPYYNINDQMTTPYTERLFVGYRGFDHFGTAPAFPFGFGLSYTTFTYDSMWLDQTDDDQVTVWVSLTNSGDVEGDEIVQVYITPQSPQVESPPKQLAGFARVSLEPGQKRAVSMVIDERAFSYWDTRAKAWRRHPGAFDILVGASSRDIRLQETMSLSD